MYVYKVIRRLDEMSTKAQCKLKLCVSPALNHQDITFLLLIFVLLTCFLSVIVKAVTQGMVTHKGRIVGNLSGNWPGKRAVAT